MRSVGIIKRLGLIRDYAKCNGNGCVEDEFHILMICKEYQAERIEFCRRINQVIVPFESFASQEQFIFPMSTNDTEVLMLLRSSGR